MQCRSKILQIQESRKIKKNEAQINRGLPNQQPIGLQPQSQHQTQNVGQSEDGDPSVPTDLDQAAPIGIPTEETQQMERNQNLSTNFSWQQQQQLSIQQQQEYFQQVMKAQLPSYLAEISERHQVAQRAAEAQNPEAQARVQRHPDSSMHVTQQYGSQQAAEFFFANSDLSKPAFSLAQQNQLQYQWGIASTSQNDPIVHSHASPQPFPTALSGSSSSGFTAGGRTIQGQQHADPCVECQRRGLLCT